MTNEQLRMQMLAGVITESEYKEKISLNEGEVTVKDVEDRIEMYTKHMAMLEKTLKTAQDKIAKEKKKAKPNQYNIEKYLEDVEFAKDEIKKDKSEIKYDQKRLEKLKKKESLNEEAFDNPFAAKVPQPQKGGGLQLKNAAMKVYSYIKKNGFTPYLVVDSKTVGDRMNHDFSIQVQRGGASEEGVLVVQGNRNKTNPQVMEKLQNDIIADFPFLTKHNQSNPSQLVIKLAVDPKANVSESLNEHYIAGGIVGIGAITQIPSRAKTDYEMAFEHFLGERYETKFENREQDLKEGGDDEMPPAPSHEETDANQVYEMEGEDVMPKFRRGVLKQLIAYAEESGSSQEAIQDLKDALARIEAEIEAEKNKKPLNEGDLGELENQIISTFDNIENMPLDPAAKLQMAKFGLGLSLVKGLLEKVKQEGSAFSKPGSRERFQSFVSDIQNATSVEEVKQALLNVIQLANS